MMKKPMIAKLAARFTKDQGGAVLIYTAAAATVMLGFVGLAMDVSFWYAAKRDMQSAADAAAMTAALEMARGATTAEVETRAKAAALLNGYTAGEVTINLPPLAGDYIGNPAFVEAVVSQPQSGFVSGILHPADMPVTSRAVATLAGAPACVIALNETIDSALAITGSAVVDLDCGAQANSTSDSAVDQTGGTSSLSASSIQSSGGYDGTNFTPTPSTEMPPMNDPFSWMTPPGSLGCLEPSLVTYNSSVSGITIPAGNYCGGMAIQGADVEFAAGFYTFGGIGLRMTGNATVTNEPDGVTFYIDPSATGQGGDVAFIAATVEATLSAPTSGPWDGILFYVDPDVDPSLDVNLSGGTDMALTGVIYARNSRVVWSGNSVSNGTWTSIVSDTITFIGNSYLSSTGFTGANVPLALASPSLAE